MRTQSALWAVLGLAVIRPTVAQEHPLMQPSRDVAVEYRVNGAGEKPGQPQTVRMYFSELGAKFRVDVVGQPGYSIMDRAGNRMLVVMPDQRMVMEVPFDPRRAMDFDSKDGTFTRRGTDTVAGVRCTVYDGRTPRHSGEVCLTDDGVMLRVKSENAGEGGNLEATKVTYGPQQPSLFTAPPDFQKMDMAHMPMGPGGAPGGRPPR